MDHLLSLPTAGAAYQPDCSSGLVRVIKSVGETDMLFGAFFNHDNIY